MRIVFTVTNDLTYDQRMIRICESLTHAGYDIKIIGVKRKNSLRLQKKDYNQKRISVFFKKGFGFYLEYNIKLFFYLLFQKSDALCCIDLDTMLPVYIASVIKRKIRIYDAHEYFPQQKEIISRPNIYRVWYFIESHFLNKFSHGYTVSESIANEFLKLYGVNYPVIKNVPPLQTLSKIIKQEKLILYQGSVNEARGFEYLIPAMKNVDAELYIFGDGNFMNETPLLIKENNLENKVYLKGKVLPEELNAITSEALIGINLVEAIGLNQLYSLANKFFDYMHHEIPQITMDFPEYKKINEKFEVAILIKELSVEQIENAINELLNNPTLYEKLKQNCRLAKQAFNWQIEEKKLIAFYQKLFSINL